jgi:surfeit locus 1 family protein
MLSRFRQAGLILPTLMALAALAVLMALGTWQVERKRWKEDLLAKIATRVAAAPAPIASITHTARAGDDIEYMHVVASGRFDHGKERYLYAPAPSGLAWHVYTPLEVGPGVIVWVNRGAVPDASKSPSTRAAGQVAGEAEVRGIVRLAPAKAFFAPQNDAANNLWYWPDLTAMTASVLPPGPVKALPFFIEADAQPVPPGGLPRGGVTRVALPNRHLEYAVTWYGIALTLVGVYLAFAISRLRVVPAA